MRADLHMNGSIGEIARRIYDGCDRSKISLPKDDPFYTMDRKSYGEYVTERNRERWASGEAQKEFLYNGSETRARLSDTEIAALANKYDPRNMDQETYDAFLNDLQSMGAISEMEKRQMGYQGMQLCAYMGEDGNWVKCGSPDGVWELPADYTTNGECIFTPWGEDTDIYKWLEDRTQEELVLVFKPSTWEQGQDYENLLKGVLKIVGRMQARREESAGANSAGIPYVAPQANGTGQTESSLPEIQYATADEYKKLLDELTREGSSIDPSAKLYNGSTTRARLTDKEIAALTKKYDVHNMSDEDFDAFLDDLESMGAISNLEKRQLGYKGMFYADIPAGGDLIMSAAWVVPSVAGGKTPIFNREDANGDVFQWINDRIQWQRSYSRDPAQRKVQEDYENLDRVLAKIVNRMDSQQTEDAEAAEKAELRRQIADPTSEFYTNMLLGLMDNMEKTKEDKEQQDIVEALGAVLDALSGKKDVSGDKASLNKAASEMTEKIGDRISQLDPDDPECIQLKQLLQRFQRLGIFIDMDDMGDAMEPDEDTFETLTQFLTRRQKEETLISTPQ